MLIIYCPNQLVSMIKYKHTYMRNYPNEKHDDYILITTNIQTTIICSANGTSSEILENPTTYFTSSSQVISRLVVIHSISNKIPESLYESRIQLLHFIRHRMRLLFLSFFLFFSGYSYIFDFVIRLISDDFVYFTLFYLPDNLYK